MTTLSTPTQPADYNGHTFNTGSYSDTQWRCSLPIFMNGKTLLHNKHCKVELTF